MKMTINKLRIGILSILIAACSSPTPEPLPFSVSSFQDKANLMYPGTVKYGEKSRSTNFEMSELMACAEDYCAAIYSSGVSANNDTETEIDTSPVSSQTTTYGRYADAPSSFISFHRNVCAADLFSRFIDTIEPVSVYEDGAPLVPAKKRGTVDDIRNCGFTPVDDDVLGSITFQPLESYEQRKEVKTIAFRYYYNALSNAMALAESASDRLDIYENLKDTWYPDTLAETLLSSLFSSLPSIVDKLRKIKISNADDAILEGVYRKNEWDSMEFGRRRALLELWESNVCTQSGFSLQPDGLCWSDATGTVDSLAEAKSYCASQDAKVPSLAVVRGVLSNCRYNDARTSERQEYNFYYECTSNCQSNICQSVFALTSEIDNYAWAFYPDDSTSDDGGSFNPDSGEILSDTHIYFSPTGMKVRCVVEPPVHSASMFPKVKSELGIHDATPIPMTNELQAAISLIHRHRIDYMALGAIANMPAGNVSGDTDGNLVVEALGVLLARENEARTSAELSPFIDLHQMCAKYGTNEQQLKDALQYMYVHTKMFPRDIDRTDFSLSPFDGTMDAWTTESFRRSSAWLLKDWEFTNIDNFNAAISEYVSGMGLVPAFKNLQQKIEPIAESFSANMLPDYEDSETKILTALNNAIVSTKQVLPDDRVEVTLREDNNDVLLELEYYATNSGGFVEFAILPEFDWFKFGDEGDQVAKDGDIAHSLLCLKELNDEEECTDLDYVFNDGPVQDLQSNDYSHYFIENLSDDISNHSSAQWVILMRRVPPLAEDSEQKGEAEGIAWKTVGVVDLDGLNTGPWPAAGKKKIFLLDGVVPGMMDQITSLETRDITSASCAPIAGVSEQCIDPNWVPAIDNEVVDPSGGQYEQSYRHYLDNAITAAQKAAQLREDIVNDVIAEAHDNAVSAAQFDKALNDYLGDIKEICGDNINHQFEGLARAMNKTEPTEFRESLERVLNRSYGCKYTENEDVDTEAVTDTETDTEYVSPAYASKRGALQCSERRNCSKKASLGTLGLSIPAPKQASSASGMSGVSWDNLDTYLDNAEALANSLVEYDVTLPDASINSDYIGPIYPGSAELQECKNGAYQFNLDSFTSDYVIDSWEFQSQPNIDILKEKFRSLLCWIQEYRTYISGILEGMPIKGLPAILSTNDVFDDTIDDMGGGLTSKLTNKYGSGLYYQKLLALAVELDRLYSLTLSFVGEIDHGYAVTKATESSIQATIASGQVRTLSSLMSTLQQSLLHEAMLVTDTRRCVDDVLKEYGNDSLAEKSRSIWNWIVRKIAEELKEKGLSSLEDTKKKSEFINKACTPIYDSIVDEGRHALPPGIKSKTVCTELANVLWGDVNIDGPMIWWRPSKEFSASTMFTFESNLTKENGVLKVPSLTMRCINPGLGKRDTYYRYGSDGNWVYNYDETSKTINGHTLSGLEFKVLCSDKYEKAYYALPKDLESLDAIGELLYEAMKKTEINWCSRTNEGCDLDENEDISKCNSSSIPIFQASVDSWQEGGFMHELSSNETFLNAEAQANNLTDQILQVGRNLEQTKYGMAQSLKAVAMKIADLSALEEKQIDLFEDFIGNVNMANASNYSNLTEWKERFDFRREQYQKQLKRARIAAWIARRAIEFRFGVDLSEETAMTIFGDRPSDWANDIYGTYVSKCGISENLAEGETAVTSCLSPEERIEEYVQKLQDYVESYGNNPNDNWWFHEDDDTAVLSLRDHFLINNTTCGTYTSNMAYFSESMGMTQTDMETNYASIVSNEEFNATPWESDTTNLTVTEDQEILGLPLPVVQARMNNEYGVFPDQQEMFTADLLESAPGVDVGISQTNTIENMTQLMGAADDYEFSIYLRTTPDDANCAAGESYFPAIGKCGVFCETAADCQTGQICMSAGMTREMLDALENEDDIEADTDTDNDTDTSTDEPFYGMCNWCVQDGACIGQDGQAVRLKIIEQPGGNVVAARNVNVHTFWTEGSVNTIEHKYSDISETAESLETGVYNIVTENLVDFSEDFTDKTDPDEGWNTDSGVTVGMTDRVAPNGAAVATEIDFSAQTALYTEVTLPSIDEGLTASIWLRAEGIIEDSVTVALRLESVDVPELNKKIRFVDVTGDWRRYSVELPRPNSDIITYDDDVMFSIAPESAATLQVWGAQIEEGLGATVYLPVISGETTYRNIIQNSSAFNKTTEWNNVLNNWFVRHDWDMGLASDPPDPLGGNETRYLQDWSVTNDPSEWMAHEVDISAFPDYTEFVFSIFAVSDGTSAAVVKVGIPDANNSLDYCTDVCDLHFSPGNSWDRYVPPTVVKQPGNNRIRIEIWPTDDPLLPSLTGQVFIWGPQLEVGSVPTAYQDTSQPLPTGTGMTGDPVDWGLDVGAVGAKLAPVNAYGCDGNGDVMVGGDYLCATQAPSYVRNTYLAEHVAPPCTVENPFTDGYPLIDDLYKKYPNEERIKLLKKAFTHVTDDAGGDSYYVYRFNMDVEDIEKGLLGQYGVLAPDNFNYRMRTLAVNVVGTDVLNCSNALAPANCAANQWLSYDLMQMGDVSIRNHHDEANVRTFNIPTGNIRGGKAWVAEQVIGYPISGAHQNALAQMQKVSLMGRPIQGIFELRIYDTPELKWPNVEDIQLVLGYHYWTKSE
jgi:hypothetical protein